MTLLVLLGAGLRALNATTALMHGDEGHYADDASWTIAPLSLGSALRFLREHPHVHQRLDPATGAMTPWPTSGFGVLGGHLTLHAYVTGLALAVVRPASRSGAMTVARAVNVVADSATIALLPGLVDALGGSAGSGVVAAALYTVFPAAVVYGSLANLDPFLAPLLVALLVVVLRARDDPRSWVLAGLVTGLLACAKQSGLLALALVPLLAWRHPWRPAIWLAVATGVVVALVSPGAYLHGLIQPSDPYLQLRFKPLAFVTGNLEALSRPSTWYWLSFSYHGRPLAIRFAHLHQVVTPLYLLGYTLALPTLALTRRWRAVVALFGPTVFLLGFIQPSNGTWRFHMAAPLVCAAIALAVGSVRRRGRAALLAGALVVVLAPLIPARPSATGAVDLGDLLFWNPRAVQPYGFYWAWKGNALLVLVQEGSQLSRRLWLTPGAYEVSVTADGPVDVTLDGQPAAAAGVARGLVTSGRFPRLVVSTPSSANLSRLAIRRTGAPSGS